MEWKSGKHAGTVPKAITPQVRSFAEKHGNDLQYVPLRPQPFARHHECYGNCDLTRQLFGGDMVLGYSIWNTKELFLSSEHHCVWRQPNGELLDVTPDLSGGNRILFVPVRDIGPDEDAQSIIEEIIVNGDTGTFFVLVESPLIEKAVNVLGDATARLGQLSNIAARDGKGLPNIEIDRFDRAMDTVDHCIDGYYIVARKREENQKRRQRRKQRKCARGRKR